MSAGGGSEGEGEKPEMWNICWRREETSTQKPHNKTNPADIKFSKQQ